MTRPNAFVKVAAPVAILSAVGGAFAAWPSHYLWIYPASGSLFLWFHLAGEKEVKYIFLFLVSVAGFGMSKFSPDGGSLAAVTASLAEVLGLWLFFFALSSSESSRQEALRRLESREAEAAGRVRALKDDLTRYRLHSASALASARDKGALSAAVREMGAAAGPEEIKSRLEALLLQYFPGTKVALNSGAARDAADRWVTERKVPLLVRSAAEDSRFARGTFPPDESSVMELPLHLFGTVVGFVRVSSPSPDRFKAEDLRAAELACTLAGVSMENVSLFDKVRDMAIKDALTGLFTHRAFQTRVEEEVLRSARTKEPFSVIMADIDHFKSFNDTYGHQAGDAVLKGVASVLGEGVREIDFVGRYGGEEFVIILTGVHKWEARTVAESLRRALELHKLTFNGTPLRVTASFGVAEFPAEGAVAGQLVRAADERLYRAKKAGRNRVVYE